MCQSRTHVLKFRAAVEQRGLTRMQQLLKTCLQCLCNKYERINLYVLTCLIFLSFLVFICLLLVFIATWVGLPDNTKSQLFRKVLWSYTISIMIQNFDDFQYHPVWVFCWHCQDGPPPKLWIISKTRISDAFFPKMTHGLNLFFVPFIPFFLNTSYVYEHYNNESCNLFCRDRHWAVDL